MITTRGNQDYPQGLQGPGYNNNYQFDNINQLDSCPSEIVFFLHGWGNNEDMAKERLDRVKLSLENNNYSTSLIGFSWKSDINWIDAKSLAKENGKKLANFIFDYMNNCQLQINKTSNIKLIGHSLGARVIFSCLDNLQALMAKDKNINNDFKITSVHLIGAAVDDEEVSMNSINHYNYPSWLHDPSHVKKAYGQVIGEVVSKFYNLFNPEDKVLEFVYPGNEALDRALGENGKQLDPTVPTPSNYLDVYVQDEIKPLLDADADGETDFGLCYVTCSADVGDNHSGYIGFRNNTDKNILQDDGAMNEVVDHWSTQ
jgi:pimeloyl-ACP methyl ester carboxylesterase